LRNAFRLPSTAAAHDAWEEFAAALDDDFNTPEALAMLHEWASRGAHDVLRNGLDVFGLGTLAELPAAPPGVVELAERRRDARERRDFESADRLRVEIEEAGWDVRDVRDGFQLVPKT
jgi:cysteinyl-tRNA synthetase